MRVSAVVVAFGTFVATVAVTGAFGQTTAPAPAPAAPTPAATPAPAPPAGPAIPVQLNKLEPLAAPNKGCRVYLVVTNPDPEEISVLRLDLVMFGGDGIISQRVAVDLGPLPPHKTEVHLFDLRDEPCDQISQMLVNDVIACQIAGESMPADQQRQACLGRLTVSSRTKAQLTK